LCFCLGSAKIILPTAFHIAGMTGMHQHIQLIGWVEGLTNILLRLTSNYYLPNLLLPSSWYYRCCLPDQSPTCCFWGVYKVSMSLWPANSRTLTSC
jgi:hypothetical protein